MKSMSIILLLSSLLCCGFASAQDTIVFRNGEKVIGKVLKVTGHEVEYKRADNADGPVYNAGFDKVSMVIYQSGSRDVFTAPRAAAPPRHDHKRERREESAKSKFTTGVVLTTIGATFLAGGVATLLYGIIEYEEVPIGIGAGLTAGGIPLTIVGSIKLHRGRKELGKKKILFGDELGFGPVISPTISPSGAMGYKAGVGMSISF